MNFNIDLLIKKLVIIGLYIIYNWLQSQQNIKKLENCSTLNEQIPTIPPNTFIHEIYKFECFNSPLPNVNKN